MSVEYAIRSLLDGDGQLAALMASRWYPLRIPENPTYPCGIYQRVSEPTTVSSHTGTSQLSETRIQLTVFAIDYDSTVTIDEYIRRILNNFRGTVGNDRLDRVIWDNDLTMFEPTTQRHQRVIDLLVWHNTVY